LSFLLKVLVRFAALLLLLGGAPDTRAQHAENLSQVKKIYVASFGQDDVANKLRERIVKQLRKNLNFTPDTLGYVELVYALRHQLTVGAVRNAAGEFVQADRDVYLVAVAGRPGRYGEKACSSRSSSVDAHLGPEAVLLLGLRASPARNRQPRVAISDHIEVAGEKYIHLTKMKLSEWMARCQVPDMLHYGQVLWTKFSGKRAYST
jgi:hypothetical protein